MLIFNWIVYHFLFTVLDFLICSVYKCFLGYMYCNRVAFLVVCFFRFLLMFLIKFYLSIFPLWCFRIFLCSIEELFACPKLRVFLTFSSRSSIDFWLTSRSTTSMEFIWGCEILSLPSPHVDIHLTLHLLFKRSFFMHYIAVESLSCIRKICLINTTLYCVLYKTLYQVM